MNPTDEQRARALEMHKPLTTEGAVLTESGIMLNTKIDLYRWEKDWSLAGRAVKAALFGILVQLAKPVMHEYFGDLYHDAMWIEHNIAGPGAFSWMVRPSGTQLTDDEVRTALKIGSKGDAYTITVDCDERGAWTAVVARYVPSDED